MAMLCLSDVFSRTWSRLDLAVPPREFWHEALQAVRARFPDFCCIAEVYWGLQARLQQLGFQLTYDKEFYDALLARDIDRLRASILHAARPARGEPAFSGKSRRDARRGMLQRRSAGSGDADDCDTAGDDLAA